MARAIALFGGSFNPPHVAHQMVALFVLETAGVDELWLLPTWKHPFAKHLVDFDHRVAMCERAAAALGPRCRVSRIEAELAARPDFVASRTLDTIAALRHRHPDDRFHLVIGADILAETDKWYRWDDVVRAAPPIVVGRGGHAAPPGAIVAGIEMPEVSSTEVRARLARGESALPLVPRAVMGYIAEHQLYRTA
ncbi:MAG: nicotinate (nicotinamide) nucleotide adenylyltransferase [Kofleriaceae bacterium]|nr:nicotinate (nicotinamide) nucleotide adenylyltransferase [Myxococcales bacterium]MCB9563819.1 nicotinate (nicotinamide) nucleotide adenylyltransferase [Kofleriaceae bacterium]MCB9573572.1 nicotinate (nicotinamide) nucleotide adenylyltransferase [Kofleriaceae bacterium]